MIRVWLCLVLLVLPSAAGAQGRPPPTRAELAAWFVPAPPAPARQPPLVYEPDASFRVVGQVLAGALAGGIGLFAGGLVGYGIEAGTTAECGDFCGLGGAVIGGVVGETAGVALGVHLGGAAEGHYGRTLATTAFATLGVLGILAATKEPAVILAVPPAQLVAAIAADAAGRR